MFEYKDYRIKFYNPEKTNLNIAYINNLSWCYSNHSNNNLSINCESRIYDSPRGHSPQKAFESYAYICIFFLAHVISTATNLSFISRLLIKRD